MGLRRFPQTNVRLPPDLKDWLRQEAEANYQSLNAEVVKRLEESKQRQEAEGQAKK